MFFLLLITRIIFKYGYEIEDKFEPLENDIYHYNDTDNLYGYKFKTDEDMLTYTSVDFLVSTSEENVKFCYSTSFGSFMEPALQDCYRVGRANTYKLNLVNPYLMYKDYSTAGDEIMKYYVGFKTVDQDQKIEIKPTLNKYSSKLRNLENDPKSISISKSNSTILTEEISNLRSDLGFDDKGSSSPRSLSLADLIRNITPDECAGCKNEYNIADRSYISSRNFLLSG